MHLCLKCKGKLLCDRKKCLFSVDGRVDIKDLEATPPSVFVGRFGYPKVFVGPVLTPDENPEVFDSPWMWNSIEEVVKLRMKVARGIKLMRVESASSPDGYLSRIQEAVASIRHVGVEVEGNLVKRPEIDPIAKPAGLSVEIKNFELEENPRIPAKVEKVYSDDLPAKEAVFELYKKGFSDYYIQKLFSAGMLGLMKKRKLVPTRWSITAVHDMIAERLRDRIADYRETGEFLLYEYEHFGNRFSIIICPGNFFKLVEIWRKGAVWSESDWIGCDEEIVRKKKYSVLSGGYYAAKLPAMEYLNRNRRKAGVVVLREITPDYTAPLGVWVVEEGVRKALSGRAKSFDSLDEAIKNAAVKVPERVEKWIRTRQNTLLDFC